MRSVTAWLAVLVGILSTHARARADAPDPNGSGVGSVGGPALISPVQGTKGVRDAYEPRLRRAIESALGTHDVEVTTAPEAARQVVECATPECVEAVLARAGAHYALVPAMWVRSGGRRELTLTLVGKSGRNINAGTVLNGDLSSTTGALVRVLLSKRQVGDQVGDDVGGATIGRPVAAAADGATRDGPWLVDPEGTRPVDVGSRAWMAGPIVLWIGGAATIVTVGAMAAMRSDSQSINGGALAGWLLLGGCAIAGGSVWWAVGRRNRRADAPKAVVHVSPGGFDLRVRF